MCKDIFVQTSKIIRAEIDRIKKILYETAGADVDLYVELILCRESVQLLQSISAITSQASLLLSRMMGDSIFAHSNNQ